MRKSFKGKKSKNLVLGTFIKRYHHATEKSPSKLLPKNWHWVHVLEGATMPQTHEGWRVPCLGSKSV